MSGALQSDRTVRDIMRMRKIVFHAVAFLLTRQAMRVILLFRSYPSFLVLNIFSNVRSAFSTACGQARLRRSSRASFFASAIELQNTLEKYEQGRKPLVGKRNRALADFNALSFHVRFPNIVRFRSGCIGFRNVPFFDALAPGRPSKFLTLIGATRYDKVP